MGVYLYFNNSQAEASSDASLFDCAESMGILVPTSCRKQGKCKECIVEVIEGMENLSNRTAQEAHLRDNFRLSCQARPVSNSGTIRCHTMRRGNMRIEGGGQFLPLMYDSLKADPAVTRDGNRILLDGKEIDKSEQPIHGLAVDLGTTTIVVRLFNLETGEFIAETSFENPQRFGGSDVMARIQYDSEQKGKLLQRTVAGYLSHAIEEFPVDPMTIYEMVVAGNSTMRDLFFRLSVYSIGQNPYQSITEIEAAGGQRFGTSLASSAKRLRIPIHPHARVYGLPVISGHVGADAAACMLAVDMANENRTVAMMDIGTNTELILGNKDTILAASCPAGPAFEGGNISCGMPGLPGAIEGFELGQNEEINFTVIGDGPPEGVCGSGLVALLSELLQHQRMNHLGRFEEDDQIIIHDVPGQEIRFYESDVNELAQAKGANVAGLHVIFNRFNIRFQDIGVFYLAGGFGRHLNIEAAKRIGLIPNIDDDKILQVGNAAIEGACIALLSKRKRMELETLVKKVSHCRLETHPQFFDYFVEGCQFKTVENLNTHDATRF